MRSNYSIHVRRKIHTTPKLEKKKKSKKRPLTIFIIIFFKILMSHKLMQWRPADLGSVTPLRRRYTSQKRHNRLFDTSDKTGLMGRCLSTDLNLKTIHLHCIATSFWSMYIILMLEQESYRIRPRGNDLTVRYLWLRRTLCFFR